MVRIWSLESGESKALEGHTGEVNSVVYSPDGRHLASGSDDGAVRIWDLETRKSHMTKSCDDEVKSVAYSPDGKFLSYGNGDGTVHIWDLDKNLEVKKLIIIHT